MPLLSTDLPTDPDLIEEASSTFVDNQLDDAQSTVDAVLILGQLDPLEVGKDFLPRWTESQRELIIKAGDLLGEWKS